MNAQNHCLNCKRLLNGDYCSHCGQRADTERLSWRVLRRELLHTFDLSRGFLYTIQELTRAPGATINGYLRGARMRYMNPIRYLLFALAVSVFIQFKLLSTQTEKALKMSETAFVSDTDAEHDEERAQFMNTLNQSMEDLITPIQVMVIPLVAWLTLWVFRRPDYRYTEHLAINAYITGHLTWLSLPVTFIVYWPPSLYLVISVLVPTVLSIWMFYRVFSYSFWGTLGRAALVLSIQAFLIPFLGGILGYLFAAWKM